MKKINNKFNLLVVVFAVAFSVSCSKKEAEYDKAKAVSVFAVVDSVKNDPSLKESKLTFPQQQQNNFWSGSSALQNQKIENFYKDFSTIKEKISLDKDSKTWSFYSGNLDDRFVFSPVYKDDKFFMLDTAGVLRAYNLKSDKTLWKTRIFPRKFLKNYQTPRISLFDDKIFAIAGTNKIAAVDANDGKIIWLKDIASIPVSTPVSDGNFVYVSTSDNKLYAFNSQTGELQWIQLGISRPTAIFGSADPVIYNDMVIASYSSGEIYAVNKKTGEPLWSEYLGVNRAVSSDFYLNDIDATPLIKDGVVYAIGNGGLMMALNAKKGDYIWKKEIAGIVNFWLAGDYLFVINNDNKLLAVNKKTGGIKWISQLPNLLKEKKLETKIIYSGIVVAGGKLLISSSNGSLIIASPVDGKVEKTISVGKKISHSPVIVNDKIYLYVMGKYIINLFEIN